MYSGNQSKQIGRQQQPNKQQIQAHSFVLEDVLFSQLVIIVFLHEVQTVCTGVFPKNVSFSTFSYKS